MEKINDCAGYFCEVQECSYSKLLDYYSQDEEYINNLSRDTNVSVETIKNLLSKMMKKE